MSLVELESLLAAAVHGSQSFGRGSVRRLCLVVSVFIVVKVLVRFDDPARRKLEISDVDLYHLSLALYSI